MGQTDRAPRRWYTGTNCLKQGWSVVGSKTKDERRETMQFELMAGDIYN